MGRRQIDSAELGRCAFLIILAMGILSCSMVYVCLSIAFRPSTSDLVENVKMRGEEDDLVEREDRERGCCRGIDHLELWGDAVNWGSDFKVNSYEECCLACKGMYNLCDSWVHCGDREACGLRFGECWLKKQKDTLDPDRRDSGEKVFWTSGLIFGKGEGVAGMETDYGTLHVKLLPDCAPHSVTYILELLASRFCVGCEFYRAESLGSSWDSEGNHVENAPFGPPYALIQGTLEAHGTVFKEIPKEDCPTIRRGSVAWVGSGPDFFISLANHNEFKKAYTVFGYVLPEDIEIAEKIAKLPTLPDRWNEIDVSVLKKPIPLRFRRINTSFVDINFDSHRHRSV